MLFATTLGNERDMKDDREGEAHKLNIILHRDMYRLVAQKHFLVIKYTTLQSRRRRGEIKSRRFHHHPTSIQITLFAKSKPKRRSRQEFPFLSTCYLQAQCEFCNLRPGR